MLLTEPTPSASQTQDAVLIDEVLRSHTFARTSSLRRLLAYLWDRRNDNINEYSIAVEALGRGANFDSKIDATVRVQIGRLRRLLDKYYAEEGRDHPRHVTIPIGSHELSFVQVEDAPAPIFDGLPSSHERLPILDESPPRPQSRPLIGTRMGLGIFAALLVCVVLQAVSFVRSSRAIAANHRELPPLWKQMLDNGKNTRIVLPAPIFFSWETPEGRSLMVRDININDPSRWADSPQMMKMMATESSKPQIWQNYTVASDTFASLRLARFLDSYNVRTSFSSSADSPNEIIDHENIVAFGTKSSLTAYQPDLDRLGFRMGLHEVYVSDLKDPHGGDRRFEHIHESGERDVSPGIVALLPKGNSGGRILLVQSSQTMALIAYLTSDEGMREISAGLTDSRNPYFEAVILSETNRGTPLQSRLGAIRSFVEPSATQVARAGVYDVSSTK